MNQAINNARIMLRMMNDMTFLSSISSIDFETKYVQVRSGYWKMIISMFKNDYSELISNHVGHFCYQLKRLWIDRFAECSANKIKDFFLGKIFNSFFNFKNILYYCQDYLYQGNPTNKDIKELRRSRYYEKKAKKWYLLSLESQISINEEHDQNIEDVEHLTSDIVETMFNIYESEDLQYEENTSASDFNNNNDVNLENYIYTYEATPHSEHQPLEPELISVLSTYEPINEFETIRTSVIGRGIGNDTSELMISRELLPQESSFTPGQTFD